MNSHCSSDDCTKTRNLSGEIRYVLPELDEIKTKRGEANVRNKAEKILNRGNGDTRSTMTDMSVLPLCYGLATTFFWTNHIIPAQLRSVLPKRLQQAPSTEARAVKDDFG